MILCTSPRRAGFPENGVFETAVDSLGNVLVGSNLFPDDRQMAKITQRLGYEG
jgi:hypothetical protein